MPSLSPSARRYRLPSAAVLVVHVLLLTWSGWKHSPNPDEAAHLVAGLDVWQHARFDLYCVNPPLPRMIAALPILCARPTVDWKRYTDDPSSRPEFALGNAFCKANGADTYRYVSLARWACMPLSVLGAAVCGRWARELYGPNAGMLALLLWCFSPNVLAWSATICPDAPAASLGVTACYLFWQWLRHFDWFGAVCAGAALGIAELSKMTWLVLFAVWPITWAASVWHEWRATHAAPPATPVAQLATILAIGLFVLNLGYAFEGTCARLGEYRFLSRALSGSSGRGTGQRGGNRFARSLLADVPVPLPKRYLEGIDLQKRDFERGKRSYLFGHWADRGWWYYYLVCAALKIPLGTWAIAVVASWQRPRHNSIGPPSKAVRATARRDAMALLFPALSVALLVSSQSGISRHFRYMLPALPFAFVWLGGAAVRVSGARWKLGVCLASALAWSTASSLWVYPHSQSYFNELAGGPMGGARYLLDSNIDWGQDTLYLREWCEAHPEATDVRVFWRASCADWSQVACGRAVPKLRAVDPRGPVALSPGWYAASVHELHDPANICHCLLSLRPVGRAGYSILIYHATREELDGLSQRAAPLAAAVRVADISPRRSGR